ncbi:MAG: hypothetical protein E7J75_00805 [Blautia sp.]|nr:hypothetical protein [Blautia sp.]
MANARKAKPTVKFNGKNVNESIAPYLKKIVYTDVACGSSDSLDIVLQNVDMKWLNAWYPTKGDKIDASILFENWTEAGKNFTTQCGNFVLDSIGFTGGPLEATFGGLAIPASESFKETERTKTWKSVTVRQIGSEIAKKYGLGFCYDANKISIAKIEQSEKTDSAFLYSICSSYGLAMKVYRGKIIIFDKGKYEKKSPVTTITRKDFIDDEWDFKDTLTGTYTGARTSYKSGSDNKEISTFIGLIKENATGSRVLRINEQADDINDAKYKAAARVNESNESATTLTGTIWANPKVMAGVTITLSGLGKANGKYYVDQVKTTVSSDGTTQEIEIHKCQTRLVHVPATPAPSKPAKTPQKQPAKKKTYKVGDIVNFHGGMYYYSSYPGAKGYMGNAGPAKITKVNGSGKAHPYHLVTINWSKTHCWGWVNSGTFD